MSSDSGEVYPGSDSFVVRQTLQTELAILDTLGRNVEPLQIARCANDFRELYFQTGEPEQKYSALRFYEKALIKLDDDSSQRSWILCKRLGLYFFEYRQGRYDRQQLLDEIDLAEETAGRIPSRKRRKADLWWLAGMRASVRNDAVLESGCLNQEPQTGRHLRLVGKAAVEPTVVWLDDIPEPAPEAV